MEITDEKKPYLIGMVIIVLLIIGSIYLLVSMIGTSFEVPETDFDQERYLEESENRNEEVQEKTVEECLADFGFDKLIYLHSPSCPACRRMTPVVQELVSEGYDIFIADAHQDSNYAKISNCISLQNSIPQVICNKNGIANVGGKSKEELIEIYGKC